MRVIETFVTSVPREKIPADAKWFVQDKEHGALLYQIGGVSPKISNGRLIIVDGKCEAGCFGKAPVASDVSETVVTREDLMRAYDLVEQGYTLWFGGECPIDKSVLVDVVCKGGDTYSGELAGDGLWCEGTSIFAYRVSQPVADKEDKKNVAKPADDDHKNRITWRVAVILGDEYNDATFNEVMRIANRITDSIGEEK